MSDVTIDLGKPAGLKEYLDLRARGYKTVWAGNGRIRLRPGNRPNDSRVVWTPESGWIEREER